MLSEDPEASIHSHVSERHLAQARSQPKRPHDNVEIQSKGNAPTK